MSLVAVILLLGVGVGKLLPGVSRLSAFAVVMVLLKLGADLLSHIAEHRRLATS